MPLLVYVPLLVTVSVVVPLGLLSVVPLGLVTATGPLLLLLLLLLFPLPGALVTFMVLL